MFDHPTSDQLTPLSRCIDENHVLKAEQIIHKSAQDFPGDIKAYLKEEIVHRAILGPFKDPPEGIHTTFHNQRKVLYCDDE